MKNTWKDCKIEKDNAQIHKQLIRRITEIKDSIEKVLVNEEMTKEVYDRLSQSR